MRYDLLRVKNILWKLIEKIIERRLAGRKGELFENFQRETNKNNGCIFYPILQRDKLKFYRIDSCYKIFRNLQVILFFYACNSLWI